MSKRWFFLAFSPSVSSSPVSLADYNFLMIRFSVWVSPTPTPRTKISIDVPVDRPKSSRSRLDCGTRRGLSGATQLDSVLSWLTYLMPSLSTSRIVKVVSLGSAGRSWSHSSTRKFVNSCS